VNVVLVDPNPLTEKHVVELDPLVVLEQVIRGHD
jgi:hypothetical protein